MRTMPCGWTHEYTKSCAAVGPWNHRSCTKTDKRRGAPMHPVADQHHRAARQPHRLDANHLQPLSNPVDKSPQLKHGLDHRVGHLWLPGIMARGRKHYHFKDLCLSALGEDRLWLPTPRSRSPILRFFFWLWVLICLVTGSGMVEALLPVAMPAFVRAASAASPECSPTTGTQKDYSGKDLTDTNFSASEPGALVGANFRKATLKGAIFANQDLTKRQLPGRRPRAEYHRAMWTSPMPR